jgi:hypothetical protein
MNDDDSDAVKVFWMTVRAALIMFIRAIEKRFGISEHNNHPPKSQ